MVVWGEIDEIPGYEVSSDLQVRKVIRTKLKTIEAGGIVRFHVDGMIVKRRVHLLARKYLDSV